MRAMATITYQDRVRTTRPQPAATTSRGVEREPARPDAEDLADILAQTRDADPQVRAFAVHRLCPCGVKKNYPDVWDRLLALAADEDVRVRGHVLHVLCDGSPRERESQVVQAVEAMQTDSDLQLRRHARKVLARYRRTGKINTL